MLSDIADEFYEYFGKEFMAYHSNTLDLEDDLSRKYDPTVIKTLLKYFKEAEKDLSYIDNYRFANVSKEDEMKEYERRSSSGCCGFYDEIVEAYGVTYKIGFNYGH